jgi:hypothetical protein
MSRRKAETPKRRISEAVVCRMLSKILRVAPRDTLEQLQDAELPPGVELPWGLELLGLYPWYATLSAAVMRGKPSDPLVAWLAAREGKPFIVSDDVYAGPSALWVVTAEKAYSENNTPGWVTQLAPVKMVVGHVKLGDADVLCISAVNIQSCIYD